MPEMSKCCTCGYEWKTGEHGGHSCAEILQKRMQEALDIGVQYGSIDGSHYKNWVIDQMIRALAGDKYDDIITRACDGEDGPNTYEWDCGIAP